MTGYPENGPRERLYAANAGLGSQLIPRTWVFLLVNFDLYSRNSEIWLVQLSVKAKTKKERITFLVPKKLSNETNLRLWSIKLKFGATEHTFIINIPQIKSYKIITSQPNQYTLDHYNKFKRKNDKLDSQTYVHRINNGPILV